MPGKSLSFAAVCAMLLACHSQGASAQQALDLGVEAPNVRNYAGIAFGAVPDYLGSDDYTVGFAPSAKIHFGEGERYVRLIAGTLSVNVLNSKTWDFGPVLNYRPGREDVDDPVVDRLREIDAAIEAGVTGGYTWVDSSDPRTRFNVSLEFLNDVSDEHEGYLITASARYWRPVSRAITATIGISTTYASDDYMSTYFGIDAIDSARSGLPQFSAGSGLRDVRIAPGLIVSFSQSWHLGAGVVYSRLLNDAADSPVVATRGTEDQIFAGVGVVYAW